MFFINKPLRRRRIASALIHTMREGPSKPDVLIPEIDHNSIICLTPREKYQKFTMKNRIQRPSDINIPLIPRRLHEHLFGKKGINDEMRTLMADENCEENKLELAPLRTDGDLSSHFEQLGNEQFSTYMELMEEALKIKKIPELPNEWAMKVGWTIYGKGGKPRTVPFPKEKLLFFDVEVCVEDGRLPTMAVALSSKNWYSWCSERLVDASSELPEFIRLNHLIPLENQNDSSKRLIIGHNVAFDRQYVREQYLRKNSSMRFWCTMSMHIACSGMADHQRNLYEKTKLNGRDFMLSFMTEENEDNIRKFTPKFQKLIEEWKKRTCKNSLEAVHARYCGSEAKTNLDKQWQTFFLKKNIEEIREKAQILFNYCASDVQATFEVFQKLYPIFKGRFPSPITSCGMLEMANTYLPITANWHLFFHKCEESSSVSKDEAAKNLIGLARETIDKLDAKNEECKKKYELDPWMWASDWSRPNKRPQWPRWYWALFQKIGDAAVELHELEAKRVRMLSREIPRLFGLCYGPYPLMFKQNYGWGFLVPSDHLIDNKELPELEEIKMDDETFVKMPVKAIHALIEENKMSVNDVLTNRSDSAANIGRYFKFHRLPHPSGKEANVGTPFAKNNKLNFDNFEHGVISPFRFSEILKSFLQTRSITRFWGNYRDRYKEQLPVWLDENAGIGAIIPAVIPAGTVTRRAVHKLWLVSTNPKKEIIGSDLKSMIQCAPGWKLVGADVDSQEQWIAALFGDSIHELKRAGATSFSKMLLAGNKANQSDLHSVVAKEVGITRDQAKVLNYARLYGAGTKHAEEFLKTQGISQKIAKDLAKKLFAKTKGQVSSFYELKDHGNEIFKKFLSDQDNANGSKYLTIDGKCYIKYPDTAREFDDWLFRNGNLTLDDLVASPMKLYTDGYESFTFNFLSLKSNELHPETPILKCRLSEALEPLPIDNDEFGGEAHLFNQMYKRTIINWFVQSSAVDFLHMLLVCMRWLCEHYQIPVRFVISIHDEVRYLVPEEDKYRCALALTLSNMYVRAAISQALGINELPMSIAFFSQVDIDTVLRKEVNMECHTPDGKLIEKGEALDICEIIQKTGGSLQKKTNSTIRAN